MYLFFLNIRISSSHLQYTYQTFLVISLRIREKEMLWYATAGFIVLATIYASIWVVGLGDKFNPFKILIFVFIGLTLSGIIYQFIALVWNVYTFGCLLVAFVQALVNGQSFKLRSNYFSEQAGICKSATRFSL